MDGIFAIVMTLLVLEIAVPQISSHSPDVVFQIDNRGGWKTILMFCPMSNTISYPGMLIGFFYLLKLIDMF
jgi:hypothetical protein